MNSTRFVRRFPPRIEAFYVVEDDADSVYKTLNDMNFFISDSLKFVVEELVRLGVSREKIEEARKRFKHGLLSPWVKALLYSMADAQAREPFSTDDPLNHEDVVKYLQRKFAYGVCPLPKVLPVTEETKDDWDDPKYDDYDDLEYDGTQEDEVDYLAERLVETDKTVALVLADQLRKGQMSVDRAERIARKFDLL